MNFVSYRQLVSDVRTWSSRLPADICAVVGVPRSGLLAALLLSLHRNCHLVELCELLRGAKPWECELRRSNRLARGGKLLVVDDSVHTGTTMLGVRSQIEHASIDAHVVYGAMYFSRRSRESVDFVFREVQQPRCFEWNLFHCNKLSRACVGLDGVLCDDFPHLESDAGPMRDRWVEHVRNASPVHAPSAPLLAIVTSRLERDRADTEEWLGRHEIQYQHLFMSPHESACERRRAADHAAQKAKVYASLDDALLFIESERSQAETIFRLTGKPVLPIRTMKLLKHRNREARSPNARESPS